MNRVEMVEALDKAMKTICRILTFEDVRSEYDLWRVYDDISSVKHILEDEEEGRKNE